MIRLTMPSIEEDDLQAVRQVLASGYLVQGAQVAAFEEMIAQYVGRKFAIAVSSGTSALHMGLLALGTSPGDIVIVTAYSWIATANVIELCGARPVFVDIDPDTFNISPRSLERTLDQVMTNADKAERVRAMLPVHTFGQLADMREILELSGRYGLPVIEDAACALGATLDGQMAGGWGVMGCFSFHPRKAITTGEGGVIVTDDSDLAKRLRALRNHGQDPDAAFPDFIMPGLNYRMTEFQAVLGMTQLKKLDRILEARRQAAAYYDVLLEATPLRVPFVAPGSVPVYQSYVCLVPEERADIRDGLIDRLRERGIEITIGTWHMPMTTYFRKRYRFKVGDFPVTDQVFARSLTLPLHEKLELSEQEKVATELQKALRTLGEDICDA